MAKVLTRDDGALELSRVCHFARVSLTRRYRNLLAEDNVDSPLSRTQQADEIEASFRRIRGAVNEVRDPRDCGSWGSNDGLSRLEQLCVVMTQRIEDELRNGDQQSSWIACGRSLITQAYFAIRAIEQA